MVPGWNLLRSSCSTAGAWLIPSVVRRPDAAPCHSGTTSCCQENDQCLYSVGKRCTVEVSISCTTVYTVLLCRQKRVSFLEHTHITKQLTGSLVSSVEASSMRSLARGSSRLCMCSLQTFSRRFSNTIRCPRGSYKKPIDIHVHLATVLHST